LKFLTSLEGVKLKIDLILLTYLAVNITH